MDGSMDGTLNDDMEWHGMNGNMEDTYAACFVCGILIRAKIWRCWFCKQRGCFKRGGLFLEQRERRGHMGLTASLGIFV